MIPRWCHRLYAHLFGYFWLPCPMCGSYFGGHEGPWVGRESLMVDTQTSQVCCPDRRCSVNAAKLNTLKTGRVVIEII